MHKTPYYGLKAFEVKGGPIDHLISKKDCTDYLANYSLLGRKCFQESFAFITHQTLDILDKQPIFESPISEESAYSLIVKPGIKAIYKDTKSIMEKSQAYPLKSLDFTKLQQELAK